MLRNWSIVRTFNADTRRLLSSSACSSFAYFGIMGVLFNLYLLRLGLSIEFIGLVIASGQFVWAVVALPAGQVGRRLGLRPMLSYGYLLIAVSISVLLLVEWLPQAWWNAWIVFWWCATWAGAAMITVTGTPYLMLAANPDERHYAFSARAALTGLMGFAGGVVAGLLPGLFTTLFGWSPDDPAPYRLGLWIVPIAYLVAIWLIAGASPLQLTKKPGQQSDGKAPIGLFLFLLLLVFLQAVGGGAARSFFNVFLDTGLEVPPIYIGAIMGIGQLLPMFVSLLTPALLERWGTTGTLFVVGVVLAVVLVVLGLATHWLVAGLGFAAIISMTSVGGTARSIFGQELVPTEWRSMSSALDTVALALGWAGAAALGGYLIGTIGFRGFFFVCALLSLLSAVVVLARVRVQRLRPQPAADS